MAWLNGFKRLASMAAAVIVALGVLVAVPAYEKLEQRIQEESQEGSEYLQNPQKYAVRQETVIVRLRENRTIARSALYCPRRARAHGVRANRSYTARQVEHVAISPHIRGKTGVLRHEQHGQPRQSHLSCLSRHGWSRENRPRTFPASIDIAGGMGGQIAYFPTLKRDFAATIAARNAASE